MPDKPEANETPKASGKPQAPYDMQLEPDGELAAFCLVDGRLFQPMRWRTRKGKMAGNFFVVSDAYGQPTLAALCREHRTVFDRSQLLTFLKPKEPVEKRLADPVGKYEAVRVYLRKPDKPQQQPEQKKQKPRAKPQLKPLTHTPSQAQ